MTALELEAKKAQLINEIDSEELLDKVQKYVRKLKSTIEKAPCQFTEEELNREIDRSLKSIGSGSNKSLAEMKAKYLKA